ncbi:hypothetical protein O6H91_05G002700 [Diphasiastrum complanatum]|uniref:Uncharacterized protein n=1 Tax=Diphasiastrum complanatum TaxID=34168 RepID=A0ACC2DKV6_DIPCM|nr:hypothetical protein O6H91_05G002700 [Diphasiastrum complanatum]
MLQGVIGTALGLVKESIKTINQETFSNTIKLVNGISALVLIMLPGNKTVLEGIQGWELRPTYRAPRMPPWMEEGVSSFNELIHEHVTHSEFEFDSDDEYGEEYESAPSSPSSQVSQLSSISQQEIRLSRGSSLGCFFQGITNPFICMFFWGPSSDQTSASKEIDGKQRSESSFSLEDDSSGNPTSMFTIDSRQLATMKEFVMHRTTDSRRRGIIEDLLFLGELSIEKAFDVIYEVLYHIVSPLEALQLLVKKFRFKEPAPSLEIKTSMLGKLDPSPTWLKPRYPYEAIRVTTEDGYILLLERIPRPDAQKVLYLQHGMFDSSLGWVANGVVGSQAFAAYDQGCDVFLGNFRGLASKEHVDKGISNERYWHYTADEHGTRDIPAMIDKIHEMKMSELASLEVIPDKKSLKTEPYEVCAVAHSLGGAALLMYVVTRRLAGRPHHLSRLTLFSPAGFHEDAPAFCHFLSNFLPTMGPILRPLVPGVYIPTRFLRMLVNKLARDFQNYPGLGGLAQRIFSYCVGGDSSNWVGAFGISHYNMYDMPGVSYLFSEHVAQWIRSGNFLMFDFGSEFNNMEVYGTPFPFDVGKHYDAIDIPVDVVAGTKDRLIPPSMVRRHYKTLKDAGVEASYEEFEYAHLDFTFAHREESLLYVMSRLMLVTSKKDK